MKARRLPSADQATSRRGRLPSMEIVCGAPVPSEITQSCSPTMQATRVPSGESTASLTVLARGMESSTAAAREGDGFCPCAGRALLPNENNVVAEISTAKRERTFNCDFIAEEPSGISFSPSKPGRQFTPLLAHAISMPAIAPFPCKRRQIDTICHHDPSESPRSSVSVGDPTSLNHCETFRA